MYVLIIWVVKLIIYNSPIIQLNEQCSNCPVIKDIINICLFFNWYSLIILPQTDRSWTAFLHKLMTYLRQLRLLSISNCKNFFSTSADFPLGSSFPNIFMPFLRHKKVIFTSVKIHVAFWKPFNSYNHVHNIMRLFIVERVFLSQQVKQSLIINAKLVYTVASQVVKRLKT